MQDGTPIIIKKKKSHKHGHHGGAWKVAYADFVTAMMAFFMVMWIMSLSDDDRQLVQAYFEDPTGFSKNYPKGEMHIMPWQKYGKKKTEADRGNAELIDQAKLRDDLAKVREQVEEQLNADPELKRLLEQQSIETKIDHEGLHIELIESDLNGEVFFKVGSAEVQPRASQVLAKIAPILAETGNPIVVEGHTDSRPFARPGYDNFHLSSDRAQEVRMLLQANGVIASQIEAVKGYADQKPRLANDPAHFSNRRVTILLPFGREASRHIFEMPSDKLNQSVEGVFRNPVRS
jgi:chemotaxis protein MotB